MATPTGASAEPPAARRWHSVRLALSFARYLRPVRRTAALLAGSILVTSVISLPVTFLPKVFTEHVHDPSYLLRYLGFVLATLAAGWALGVLQSYWTAALGEAVVRSLRSDVFAKLRRLPPAAAAAGGPTGFVQHINRDVMAVRQVYGPAVFYTAMDVARGFAVVAAMVALDPGLTASVGAAFVMSMFLVRAVNRRVETHVAAGREQAERISDTLIEHVGGLRDLAVANRLDRAAAEFESVLRASQMTGVRTAVWSQVAGLIPAALVSLSVVGAYYLGLRRVTDARDVGELVTYAALLGQVFPAVLGVVRASTDLAAATPGMASLRSMLDQSEQADRPGAVPIPRPLGPIRFEGICLDLDGRRVIDNMTFEIPVGRLTAIVGQSGAGKTTVFHLLLRLMEPTAGVVRVGGRPVEEFTTASLREAIGFIPQNPFIFNRSLRENILVAAEDGVPADRLAAVVRLAQLDEVVAQRMDQGGLDAPAGYMGSRLSGGERQRIALARAALRDPDLIVCDEYTANVDVQTAALIHQAVREHFAGRTRVVITHELATARGADYIIVIDGGAVVQQGSHEELSCRPGLYRRLLEVQQVR